MNERSPSRCFSLIAVVKASWLFNSLTVWFFSVTENGQYDHDSGNSDNHNCLDGSKTKQNNQKNLATVAVDYWCMQQRLLPATQLPFAAITVQSLLAANK